MDEIKNLKKSSRTKVDGVSLCVLINCLYYNKDE